MEKNVFNNIWYVLTKTWKYEKRLIFIIILQIVIGAVVPLAGVTLPALVVNGISNGLDHAVIAGIAMAISVLLIMDTAAALRMIPMQVLGNSMFPRIKDGDYIIVEKVNEHYNYNIGDIIVFYI